MLAPRSGSENSCVHRRSARTAGPARCSCRRLVRPTRSQRVDEAARRADGNDADDPPREGLFDDAPGLAFDGAKRRACGGRGGEGRPIEPAIVLAAGAPLNAGNDDGAPSDLAPVQGLRQRDGWAESALAGRLPRLASSLQNSPGSVATTAAVIAGGGPGLVACGLFGAVVLPFLMFCSKEIGFVLSFRRTGF